MASISRTVTFRDTPQPLDASARQFIQAFHTAPDELPGDTVRGWKGPHHAPGGAYEKRFLNELVLRVLTEDPPEQAAAAAVWIAERRGQGQAPWVSDLVVAEVLSKGGKLATFGKSAAKLKDGIAFGKGTD